MQNPPVHWSEGLFLRPHHFQAADRAWEELGQAAESLNHPYAHGLRELRFLEEAVANHQFRVESCRARTRQGTIVVIGKNELAETLDMKDALAQHPSVTVYLAVPSRTMGKANVASGDGPAAMHRYVESRQSVYDESGGGNPQEIAFRRLNVRLMLSTQDTTGYELVELCRVKRAGDNQPAPEIDADYIPPVLAVEAWPGLTNDIVQAIYHILGARIEVLSDQVVGRGITLAGTEPGDLDRLLMLHVLNAAYSYLGVLVRAAGVHPFAAYSELCRLVGQLSIFGPQKRCPAIPAYDHDNLAEIFRRVKELIELLLGSLPEYEFEMRWFVGQGAGMFVSIDPRWLGADWDWYVGVHRGALGEQDCSALLQKGALDWKLGSARRVELIFTQPLPGLELKLVRQTPRALPADRQWSYYTVTRDDKSVEWRDVRDTQTLAMRFSKQYIGNLDSLQGQRQLIVAERKGQPITLQFALFAVPRK